MMAVATVQVRAVSRAAVLPPAEMAAVTRLGPEWLWFGALFGGVAVYLIGIELLSRWTSASTRPPLTEEDEDEGPPEEDVDGTDEAITDADE